jgi:hypothetical protein
MRRPDFFIVGAPKCGTTAMHKFLAQHPEVFLAPKEVHFFGSDLHLENDVQDLSTYLELFTGAKTELRVGEASVWYLYSRHAAKEIKEFFAGSRIIIQLRNPADMVHSLHSQLLFSGVEDIQDFESALRAEERGRILPFWRRLSPTGMRYYDVGNYSAQVERYLKVFGPERVNVIIFDELKKNPLQVYGETCKFLGVRTDFEPKLSVVNPNKKVRNKALRMLIQEPPAGIRRLAHRITTRSTRQKLAERLQPMYARYEPRPPLSQELRRELQSYFAPDIRRLSDLLGRDLTYWYRS